MDHGANISFSTTCVKGTCRQDLLSHLFIYLLTNAVALCIALDLSNYLFRITETGRGILTMFGFRYFVEDWTMYLVRIVCTVPRLIIATIIILPICVFFPLSIIIEVVPLVFWTLIGIFRSFVTMFSLIWIQIVVLFVVTLGIFFTCTWNLFATVETSQDFFFI